MHAVTASLDTLSVKDICENADISRGTFYRHFDSKYDIPIWHARYCQKFYLDEVGRTIDWETGYFHQLRLLSEERTFYHHAIDYTSRSLEGLDTMDHHRKQVIIDTLQNYRHVEIDGKMMFCIDSFVRIESITIAKWLRTGLIPPPKRFAKYLTAIVPPSLFEAMELPT